MSFPRSNLNKRKLPSGEDDNAEIEQPIKRSNQLKRDKQQIPPLTYAQYSTGNLILGYVLQVNAKQVIVSLPGGLTGSATSNEISDAFHGTGKVDSEENCEFPAQSLLKVHQPVCCYVLDKSSIVKNKHLNLSLRCSLINRNIAFKHLVKGSPVYGAIESKEDHGFLVSTGIADVTFFLPMKRVPSSLHDAQIGEPIVCTVDSKNDETRIVKLKMMSDTKLGAVLTTKSFKSFLPGSVVNALIRSIEENGLVVRVSESFDGFIDSNSLPQFEASDVWKKRYNEGDVLVARIIYIDQASKVLRLSIRPHIMEWTEPRHLPQLGEIMTNLAVIKAVKKSGVCLSTTSKSTDVESEASSASIGVYIHKSALSSVGGKLTLDDDEDDIPVEEGQTAVIDAKNDSVVDENNISKLYPISSLVSQVRVLGYQLVEGIVVGSNLKQSLDSNAITHWSQIKVGDVVPAKIKSIQEVGLMLEINCRVRAFCPIQHVLDGTTTVSKLHGKFKVGSITKVRVWQVKSDGSIIVTAKKRLIESVDLFSSYDEATTGKLVQGIVTEVEYSKGVRLHFFNGIKGYIPTQILFKQGVDSIESYRTGQLLHCYVVGKFHGDSLSHLSLPQSKYILLLALALGSPDEVLVSINQDLAALTNGATNLLNSVDNTDESICSILNEKLTDFVSGVVSKIEDDCLKVSLDNGRVGSIHKHQCFDFVVNAEDGFKNRNYFKVGTRLTDLIILSDVKRHLELTMKPMLVEVLKQDKSVQLATETKSIGENLSKEMVPRRIGDLIPGQIVVGFVVAVEEFGILIKFLGGLVALVPRPNLADKFVSTPVGLFSVGNTMRCVVQRVDQDNGRVILTCKSLLVSPSTGPWCYIQTQLREKCQVFQRNFSKELPWARYPVGSVFDAIVLSMNNNSVILLSSSGTKTTVIAKNYVGIVLTKGQTMTVRVIGFDFSSSSVEVSLDKDLIKAAVSQKNQPICIDEDAKYIPIRIESVHSDYLVGSINTRQQLVIVMIADYHSPYLTTEQFKVNTEISGYPVYIPASSAPVDTELFGHLPVFSTVERAENPAKIKTAKSADSNKFFQNLKVGKVLEWKVIKVTQLEVIVTPNQAVSTNEAMKFIIHISGAIDVSNKYDNLKLIMSQPKGSAVKNHQDHIQSGHPFHGIAAGQVLKCRILQVRREQATTGKPPSTTVYLSKAPPGIEATAESDEHDSANASTNSVIPFRFIQWHGRNSLKPNLILSGVVTEIYAIYCVISFSPYVSFRLNYLDVSSDKALVKQFKNNCYIGLRILVGVLTAAVSNNKVNGLAIARIPIEKFIQSQEYHEVQEFPHFEEITPLKPGQTVIGIVDLEASSHANRPPAYSISLGSLRSLGRICATELADPTDWVDASSFKWGEKQTMGKNNQPSNSTQINWLQHGQIVKCKVLSTPEDEKIELSCRASRLSLKKKSESLYDDAVPEVGSIVKGFVTNISPKGCFVRIALNRTAIVYLKDLCDSFVKSPQELYPVGKLVEGRVVSIDNITNAIRMSLKLSDVHGNKALEQEMAKLKAGQIISGTVKQLTDFGIFVAIEGTSIVGLSRKNFAISNQQDSLADVYSIGDVVRVKILSVDSSKKKVSLALKDSFFKDEDLELTKLDTGGDNVYAAELGEEGEIEDGINVDTNLDAFDQLHGVNADNGEVESQSDYEPVSIFPRKTVTKSVTKRERSDDTPISVTALARNSHTTTSLVVSNPFVWSDFGGLGIGTELISGATVKHTLTSVTDDDDDEDDDISAEENAAHGSNHAVKKKKNDDAAQNFEELTLNFEKNVLAHPNSSYVWVQYIAYHITKLDIAGAREIAERSLKVINFREEDELFNVWVAYLALELKYGNSEVLQSVFQRAIVQSKGKYIHLKLAELYEASGDIDRAKEIYDISIKKYKYSKKVWSSYQIFLLRINEIAAAKLMLSRSMQSLSRHKHFEVIEKFGLAEFEFGSVDRARIVFENLLSSYPNRVDAWHVYLDKEVKLGYFDQARQLFERLISMKLSSQNLKTVFKKYLAFEVEHGTVESQNGVKAKAREYVMSRA